ncbi:selenocysteine-specific translation elongation factor [Desulfatitalea tepidiphila]|uniref:selenocysteine-specific translation elongation factor n=1 Tax=Desulfatitalea tepidiphila TaxID=1185843 RepID=UPI0006B4B1BE|nr:selenocysteine-specific translation elongation factor [Desulfatitalea tepidiphila]
MKPIILGTAGHIDHGKTTLIKALTGINTDRLKEEKLRGITIELGFAHLELPSGQRLGIVDVPGHEKFVKNMVAGATGIDLVALVIAADEGIMPQTREHMEICTLLGIRHGVVVITKRDMVDEEWLAMVQEEIADFTRGTFLDEAPVVPVSAITGQGLPEFIATLDRICEHIPAKTATGLFRLPVDRVFSMKGFGTVITGTLISGKVAVGDRVMLYPSGVVSKVRGLQVHNQSLTQAEAGMRTAINFQGLEKAAVNRGDVLAKPEELIPSYMVDADLLYLASNAKPLKNRTRVRFHSGTNEIMAVVVLLDREEARPGEHAPIQIRMDVPVTLVKDDRYVLRSYSPIRTIGGGAILDPIPPKHKRHRPDIIEALRLLTEAPPEEVVRLHIENSGFKGCAFGELLIMTNLPEKQLERILQDITSKRTAILVDKEKRRYVHQKAVSDLQKAVTDLLEAYHQKNPLKPGMSKEELKSKLPLGVDNKLALLVLQQLMKAQAIVQEEDMVRLAGHRVALGVDQRTLRTNLLTVYQKEGLTPPYFKELCSELSVPAEEARQVLSLLIDEGHLIKIKEELYCHREAIDKIRDQLVAFLSEHEEISTPQFKDMTGASRKYVIPLIEYFDTTQLTIRIGDMRKLRKRPTGS